MISIYLIHCATTSLHIFIWRAGTEPGCCHTNTCNSPAIWILVPPFPATGETDTVTIESLRRVHAVDAILSNCKSIIDANLKIIGTNFNATPCTYILLLQYCISWQNSWSDHILQNSYLQIFALSGTMQQPQYMWYILLQFIISSLVVCSYHYICIISPVEKPFVTFIVSHFLLAAKIVGAEHEYALPISLCSVFKDETKL